MKQATTPTPSPTPTGTPVKMEEEEEESMKPSTSDRPLLDKPVHVTEGGGHYISGVPTVTSPPKSPEWVWTPISVLSTRRRLCCAPSVEVDASLLWTGLGGGGCRIW